MLRIRRLLTAVKDPIYIRSLLSVVNIISLQELIMSDLTRKIAQLFVIGRFLGICDSQFRIRILIVSNSSRLLAF